jgi:hypothetical protein
MIQYNYNIYRERGCGMVWYGTVLIYNYIYTVYI